MLYKRVLVRCMRDGLYRQVSAVSRLWYDKECVPAQVYLTDLEWAGKVGEANYPIFMNCTDNIWSPGASDNQPITLEHDEYWMQALLSELYLGYPPSPCGSSSSQCAVLDHGCSAQNKLDCEK